MNILSLSYTHFTISTIHYHYHNLNHSLSTSLSISILHLFPMNIHFLFPIPPFHLTLPTTYPTISYPILCTLLSFIYSQIIVERGWLLQPLYATHISIQTHSLIQWRGATSGGTISLSAHNTNHSLFYTDCFYSNPFFLFIQPPLFIHLSFFPSNTSYSSIPPPSINTLYSIINPSFSNYSTITILLHPFYHYYWNTTTSLRSTSLTHQTQNGFSTLSSNSTPSTSLLLSFHVDERSETDPIITSITPLVREERMVMNWLIFLLKAIREWYWMNTNGILCESKQFKWNESVRFHWIWFVVWVDEL